MRRTVSAIRAIDPQREIVIDGIYGGGVTVPELADLEVDAMTPLEAITKLYELREKARQE
jgi:hypothetical protein